MPLMLDDMREEFARFLAEDPAGRFRMDAALAHVITLAYRAGVEDGEKAACMAIDRGYALPDDAILWACGLER